jgi:hypothetical protein
VGVNRISTGYSSLDRSDWNDVARSLYELMVEQYRGRLIMLCDGGRVLARSDKGLLCHAYSSGHVRTL